MTTSRYIATMRETKLIRDERRARRWLVRSRITAPMSYEAWDLLVRRLRVRAQTRSRMLPLIAVAGGVMGAFVTASDPAGTTATTRWSRDFGTHFFLLVVILTVASIIAAEINTAAERRLGRALAHRVSRTEAVSLRVILGPARTWYVAVTLALNAAIAISVPFAHAGWLGWGYPVAFVSLVMIVAVAVSRAYSRLTLAIDPMSLAIDERLRADDVFNAFSALSALSYGFLVPFGQGAVSWLALLWFGTWVVSFCLYCWAQKRPPWWRHEKTSVPPTPVPDAVSR